MEISIIEDIARAGAAAPSGHNTAPWRMEYDDRRAALSVYLVPGADATPYNAKERGSYMALGALAENVRIAALRHGFRCDIRLFPRPSDRLHVADITFYSGVSARDAEMGKLYAAIDRRATNRKPYARRPLSSEDAAALHRVVPEGPVSIHFVSDDDRMRDVARGLAVPDRLFFENRSMHGALFPHIIWKAREAAAGVPGLYIKTLELPMPVRLAFRLFRFWPIARTIGLCGFGRAVAAGNAKLYAECSTMALIAVQEDADEAFVQAGRALERLWLTATTRTLAVQPVAGVFALALGLADEGHGLFSSRMTSRIHSAVERTREIGALENAIPVMALRIGYAGAPSARTGRRPATSILTVRS